MANKILIKKAGTQGKVPLVGDIDLAELAINTYDGRLFAKKDGGGVTSVVDLTENAPVRLLGDASSTYAWDLSTYTSNVTTILNTVNANVGTFGSKVSGTITIPIVSVNHKGLVTAVTTETFSAAQDLGTMSLQNSSNISVTGGSIDGTAIGVTTAAIGKFTSINASGNVVIAGDLTVQGLTTTVNSTTVTIADKNIELATAASNKATADGGGITLNLGTDGVASITYAASTESWNLNQNTKVTGTFESSGTATVGALFTTGTLGAGASTLGATTASSLDNTPIGGTTASTGAFTTLSASGNVALSSNATIGGNLSVAEAVTVKDLTITGTTSLASISSSAVSATQVVYGSSTGAFKGESDFTYNETTNTLSAGAISLVANAFVGGTLTVSGATSLGDLKSTNVAATQLVYGGAAGLIKSHGDLTYNDSTRTINTGNLTLASNAIIGGSLTGVDAVLTGNLTVVDASISGTLSTTGLANFAAAVSVNSSANYTAGTYSTGAFKVVGDASIAGALQVFGTIRKAGFDVLNTADTIDGGTF